MFKGGSHHSSSDRLFPIEVSAGMQRGRQAAHQVGLLPGPDLLAGADDLVHEEAVGGSSRSAHLAVQPQRRTPLPGAVAHRDDGAPGPRPGLSRAARFLRLGVCRGSRPQAHALEDA